MSGLHFSGGRFVEIPSVLNKGFRDLFRSIKVNAGILLPIWPRQLLSIQFPTYYSLLITTCHYIIQRQISGTNLNDFTQKTNKQHHHHFIDVKYHQCLATAISVLKFRNLLPRKLFRLVNVT